MVDAALETAARTGDRGPGDAAAKGSTKDAHAGLYAQ